MPEDHGDLRPAQVSWHPHVFRSTNGGANWRPFSEGLLTVAIRRSPSIPPAAKLYAGTYGGGRRALREVQDVAIS
jgi:hypothetical protein